MRGALKANWVLLAGLLFAALNAVFLTYDQWWFSALPVALLLAWAMMTSVQGLFFFIVFATPLSINLEELELGGIGVALPTEPLMVGLMFLFWIKVGLARDVIDPRIWRHPITVVLGLQLLWMALCIIPSSMPLVSTKFLLARLWFVTSMFFVPARIFEQERNMRRFAWMYMAGLILVISYTLIRHSTFGFAHDPAHWVMEPFFKDHTSYGAIIAFFFPFAFTIIGRPGAGVGERTLAVLFFLILSAGMVFSYTRAAWVGVAGALGLFLVMKLRIRAWVIGLVALGGLGWFLANQDQVLMSLERNRDESSDDLAKHVSSISNISSDASNLERINRWHSALRMFEERPVMGWGPGTYMFQYAPFQSVEDRTIISTNFGTNGNAHSEFLGPLAEQGVPGALLVVALVGVSCYTGIRLWSRMPPGGDRRMLGAAFFGLITYYIHGTLNNFLDLDKASVPFWGFTAILVVMDLKYPVAQKKRTTAGQVA